jgi:hypothetical protein
LGAGLVPYQKSLQKTRGKDNVVYISSIRIAEALRKLCEIPPVVRTAVVDTLMDTEMFPVFDRLEGMPAIRAL